MTVADPKRFTFKDKPVIYTGAFIGLNNWRNNKQINKIYGMIEFEKMHALTAENPHNLGAHQIIEMSWVLRNTHIISRNQDIVVFYINNYIDEDPFNQLYDSD